jgi:hypothetical protein
MDSLTFIANLVGHLAWPVAIVVVSLIFRKEFSGVFARAKLLKVAGVEVSLEEEVNELTKVAAEGGITTLYPEEAFPEEFQQEMRLNPKWAFLEIWIEVEQQIKKMMEMKSKIYRGALNSIAELEFTNDIPSSEADILRRLSQVRNRIVHGDSEITEVDVNALIGTARSMRDRLAQKVRPPSSDRGSNDPFAPRPKG